MGIAGLMPFLRKKFPQAIRTHRITEFKNSVFMVDLAILLNKVVYFDSMSRMNGSGNTLLMQLANALNWFKDRDIEPVFVLDGEKPKQKSHIHAKRKRDRETREKNIDDLALEIDGMDKYIDYIQSTTLGESVKVKKTKYDNLVSAPVHNTNTSDPNTYTDTVVLTEISQEMMTRRMRAVKKEMESRLQKRTLSNYTITTAQFNETVAYLRKHKYVCVTAPREAEELCAVLSRVDPARYGKKIYGYSADSDCWPYGAHANVVQMHNNKEMYECWDLRALLRVMDLTLHQFLCMCLLCGCDYCPKIKNIGAAKAYGIVKKHDSMGLFKTWIAETHPGDVFGSHFEAAYDIFMRYQNVTDLSEHMDFQEVDTALKARFCVDREEENSGNSNVQANKNVDVNHEKENV